MNYIVLLIAMLVQMQEADQDWSPPKKPDPSKILRAARDDADAGRYKIALQKHVWFHENALEHRRGLYGVRLSFALSSWQELGENYEPALTKLREIRAESAKSVTAKQPVKVAYHLFHDVTAIDRSFKEPDKTTKLFMKLDKDHKQLAKDVYKLAQPALLESKKYELCGKYIDAKKDLKAVLKQYDELIKLAKDPQFGESTKFAAGRILTEESASLVAILAVNKRQEEADEAAKAAKAAWDDKKFHKLLDEASQGKFPVEAK